MTERRDVANAAHGARSVDLTGRNDVRLQLFWPDGRSKIVPGGGAVQLDEDALCEVLLEQRLSDADLDLLSTGAIAGVALLNRNTSDDDVGAVCEMAPDLRRLRAPDAPRLTPRTFEVAASLGDLRFLQLRRVRKGHDAAGALGRLGQLRHLSLDQCNLTDAQLSGICESASIRSLYLDGNRDLTETGFRDLSRLTELQHLSLNGCNIGDEALIHLSGLRQLAMLGLSSTRVSLDGLCHLPQNPNMIVTLPQGSDVCPIDDAAEVLPHATINGKPARRPAPQRHELADLPTALRVDAHVLALFTSPHCAPCKSAEAALSAMPAQVRDRVKVVQLDVTEQPDVAHRFSVHTVPSLVLMLRGQELYRRHGGSSPDRLAAELRPHLGMEEVHAGA